MTASQTGLKLGKGSGFVKTKLRHLPLVEDCWEVDIQPIPAKHRGDAEFWLGMVVEQEGGSVLAILSLDQSPTVNDLATMLAHAMSRPLTEGECHRPTTIHMRPNPEWEDLLPHLQQLGIESVSTDALPVWSGAVQEFGTQWQPTLRSLSPGQSRRPTLLESSFSIVSKWVRRGGWIEIGEQQGLGFVVRALDEGGVVYETTEAKTLDEAMALLERGITNWLDEHGVDLG